MSARINDYMKQKFPVQPPGVQGEQLPATANHRGKERTCVSTNPLL